MSVTAKTLRPRQQERVRQAIVELVKEARTQGDLARELSVRQQTISNALHGRGIGVKLARAVAALRAQTFEELVEGKAKPRQFKDLDGWEMSAQAVVRERRATAAAVRSVSRWPMFLHVQRAEPRLVADLVALWVAWTPLDIRTAVEISEAPTESHGSNPTPAAGTVRVPVSSERRPRKTAEQ